MATRNKKGQYKKSPVTAEPERTGEQMRSSQPGGLMQLAGSAGQMLWGNGGSALNPMGFPGYTSLYTGTYQTYRWMLQHPVLQLARSIATGIIGASTWEYEKVDAGANDDWLKYAEECFSPLRDDLITDFFFRGRDYGWTSGEPIWQNRRGRTWLTKVKPLLNDISEILTDDTGNAIGVRNHASRKKDDGTQKPFVDLSMPYKAWKYTYDSEAGYVYGRSWLENVRSTAWREWLDCAQQLQRLGAKITGIVTVITSPAGNFPGPIDTATGKPTFVSYQANADKVIKALAGGAAGVWFPSLGLQPDAKGNIDAMKVLLELAGKSLTNIEVLDFGTQSPAIMGILERMKHAEELMFNGALRSSRTGLEGKHGTKEEAGVHTDTGTLNAETDDREFARQCQPLLDGFLELNFGENAVGRVKIKPVSLVDRKSQILRSVLLSLINDPSIAMETAATLDMDRNFKTLGMITKKPFDAAAAKKASELSSQPKSAAPKVPNPEGGKPKD